MRNSFVRRLALGLLVLPLVACLVIVFTNESGERHGTVETVSATVPAIPTLGLNPTPTEIVRWKEDRKKLKREREEWLESLHYAAPGTDWRAIEQANRRANILRRQELKRAQARSAGPVRGSQWNEVGSNNQAGRTRWTAWSPDDDALYVGSDNGGVWKGNLDGSSWQPISDDIGYGANQVYVTPGSPTVLTFCGYNGEIWVSTDDGGTWSEPGGFDDEDLWEIVRIVRDQGSPRTLYAMVRGQHATAGNGFHLYRSTDGGLNYSFVHNAGGWPRCDIWIDRVSAGPLYMMVGPTMYRSETGGDSWTQLGTAPVEAAYVVLEGSEAGAPTFYAAMRTNGGSWRMYRSADGGMNWEDRHAINDFWETVGTSITNPDIVLFAGVEVWRSTDGGGSFTRVNTWGEYYGDPEFKLHADNPSMQTHWIDGQEIFLLNTDGGTYKSYDQVDTVQNISLEGLGISQYYDIFTSANDPYLIAAGAQDQGYQVSIPDDGRDPFLDFDQIISGDYGQMTSTNRDHNFLFSCYPGFILIQVTEEYQNTWSLDFPSGATYNAWMPPMHADPLEESNFYFCADHLWLYDRINNTSNYEMIELPYDFAADGDSAFISGLAISQADYNYWYAVGNAGNFWYSHDAGQNWTMSTDTGPGNAYLYGTSIIASPTDPLTAWVGGSGYSNPAVYRTVDGGVSWQAVGDGLPSTLVYMLAFDNDRDQRVFAASEAGPYQFDEATQTWSSILGTEAPMTTYWAVEGVPELGVVRFGTYGRGIWDYAVAPTESAGVVLGPGPGENNPPLVNTYRAEWTAYGVPKYGVNVATGDVDGNGIDEVLTGAGPGSVFGPHVRGFDDLGNPVPGLSFLAYGTNKYGVNVAAGDIDADGYDEIITGAGPGAVFGPHVRGFNHDGSSTVTPVGGVSYFAYGTLKYGVNVTAGDIDGDGIDEIVTGAGPGAVFGPHVRGWNVDGGPVSPMAGVSYFAYGTLKYGVNVGCGDVDGDGIDEIITGAGPSPVFASHVRGWNVDGGTVAPLPGFSLFAWPAEVSLYGAKVASGTDLDGDGRDEIVVGNGPDPDAGPMVRVFRYSGTALELEFDVEAFPGSWTHGATVASGRF